MLKEAEEKLLHNMQRLCQKKFFHQDIDLISVLLPGEQALLYVTLKTGPDRLEFSERLDQELPDAVSKRLKQHISLYQQRPDAGTIAHLSPQWCGALSQLNEVMPSVFDEPARHIGKSWRVDESDDVVSLIKQKGNAGTYGNQLLVLGVTQNRMVFNAELFEKCAMAYTLARMSGKKISKVPWWVRLIAGNRLKSDMKKATEKHLSGEDAEELTAY